jgi:hypothetical protein
MSLAVFTPRQLSAGMMSILCFGAIAGFCCCVLAGGADVAATELYVGAGGLAAVMAIIFVSIASSTMRFISSVLMDWALLTWRMFAHKEQKLKECNSVADKPYLNLDRQNDDFATIG